MLLGSEAALAEARRKKQAELQAEEKKPLFCTEILTDVRSGSLLVGVPRPRVLGTGGTACSVKACVPCFVRDDGSTWKSVLPKDATKGGLHMAADGTAVMRVAESGIIAVLAVSLTNRLFSSAGRLCSLAKPNSDMVLAWRSLETGIKREQLSPWGD